MIVLLESIHPEAVVALEAVDEAIIEEMDVAMASADASPQPVPEHRFKNVYVEE